MKAVETLQVLFILIIFAVFKDVGGLLDIDELKTINYGIDILSTPVVKTQDSPPGAIYLTTKYGQPYQCSYPDTASEQKKVQEEEKVAVEMGISELLRPMDSSPCLIHSKGWWTYEFCYGKHIRQYHLDDGKITGNVLSLGQYESEFDWENTTEKSNKNRLSRYHSQQYVNGSNCDLTGKPRRTEVRFVCEEGQGDYVSRVDEPESCVYVITVHTMKICHHPYLKSATPATPVPITCNPLLTEDQYNLYLQQQEDEKKKKQEEILRSYQDILTDSEADDDEVEEVDSEDTEEGKEEEDGMSADGSSVGEESSSTAGSLADDTVDALQKLFTDSLHKELQGVLGEEQDSSVKVKVVRDVKDLEKFIASTFNPKKLKKTKPVSNSKDPDESSKDEEDEEDEDDETLDSATSTKSPEEGAESEGEKDKEDGEMLDYFEKELNSITDDMDHPERLEDYRENIESAMHAQFGDIVDEAAQELEEEGVEGDIDRQVAFKQLATTLNKLLGKLKKAENDINTMNEEIKGKMSSEDDMLDEDEEDFFEGESQDNTEDPTSENLPGLDSDAGGAKPAQSKLKLQKPEPHIDGTEQQSDTQSHVLDNRVRVRVTRVKHQPSGEKGDTPPSSQTTLKLPEKQKQKLAASVKDELEKAGMDTQGRNIEVKIITAGYYDSDDESLHLLSDEDSSAFNKMVITILGGSQEAAQEQNRQQKMEDNYSFVFGQQNNDRRKKSGSGEI